MSCIRCLPYPCTCVGGRDVVAEYYAGQARPPDLTFKGVPTHFDPVDEGTAPDITDDSP